MRRDDLTCAALRRLGDEEAGAGRDLPLEDVRGDDGAGRCTVARDGDGETLTFFTGTDLAGSRRLLARFVSSFLLITLS